MAKKKRRKKKDSQKNDPSIYVDDLYVAYDQSNREFSKLESIDFGFRQNSSPESINNELDKPSEQIDTKTTEQILSQENTNQESTHHNEGEKGATPSTPQEPNTPLDNGQQKLQEGTKQGESSSQESDSTPDNQFSSDKSKMNPNNHQQEEDTSNTRQEQDEQIIKKQKLSFEKDRAAFNRILEHSNSLSKTIKSFEDSYNISKEQYDKYSKKIHAAKEEYRKEIAKQYKDSLLSGKKMDKMCMNAAGYEDEIYKRAFRDEIKALDIATGETAVEVANAEKDRLKKITEYVFNKDKMAALNSERDKLAKRIAPLIDEKGKFNSQKALKVDATAKSGGWKGKAKIFGGIAAGALALTGVASLMMSGGRQENSNLYNPYQAMY